MAVEALLTIGRLAREAGVNVQTVRYYERVGLLPMPDRSQAGYRQYPAESVRIIRFIKNAQQLGFSLAEIADLMRFRSDRRKSCRHVRAMVRTKLTTLADQVESLQTAHSDLSGLLKMCRGDSPASECPIIDALDRGEVTGGNGSRRPTRAARKTSGEHGQSAPKRRRSRVSTRRRR